jgi:hypothetical protein
VLVTAAGRRLGLLSLQALVQHLDGPVDVARLAGDGDEALVRVGSLAAAWGSAGLGDADLALGLCANLVDLDAGLANDWEESSEKEVQARSR